jgi:hypothetical protein
MHRRMHIQIHRQMYRWTYTQTNSRKDTGKGQWTHKHSQDLLGAKSQIKLGGGRSCGSVWVGSWDLDHLSSLRWFTTDMSIEKLTPYIVIVGELAAKSIIT